MVEPNARQVILSRNRNVIPKLVQSMEDGVLGITGQTVVRLVEVGKNRDLEYVTIQPLLTAERHVKELHPKNRPVTRKLACVVIGPLSVVDLLAVLVEIE